MNLSSLSDADLDLIFSAIESANSDAASEVYDAVMEETERRKAGKHEARTGYRIELNQGYQNKDRWNDMSKTYFDRFGGVNRFFPTVEAAQKAVDQLNVRLARGDFEGWRGAIPASKIRFVQITTTREII